MVSIHTQYELSSRIVKGKGVLGTVNFSGGYINLISISQKLTERCKSKFYWTKVKSRTI